MVVAELEQARNVLAEVGVELADHIPSIVVVGDQSTGKSSLLSALTNLRLPDGNATCTRAPLKILIRPCAKPGEEHSATLRYKLRTDDGGAKFT
jgi:GTP-binding protein EngB required for normal cell division